jgi:hypothetical protein
MSTHDDAPAANPPRRKNLVWKLIPVVAVAAVIIAVIINSILPPPLAPDSGSQEHGQKPRNACLQGRNLCVSARPDLAHALLRG